MELLILESKKKKKNALLKSETNIRLLGLFSQEKHLSIVTHFWSHLYLWETNEILKRFHLYFSFFLSPWQVATFSQHSFLQCSNRKWQICEGEECHLHVLNDFCFNLKSSNVCVFGLKGRKVLLLAESDCAAAASEKRCFYRKTFKRIQRSAVCERTCCKISSLSVRGSASPAHGYLCFPPRRREGNDARAPRYEESCRCHSQFRSHRLFWKWTNATHAVRARLLQTPRRQMSHHCVFLFIHRAFSTSVQVINQTETKITRKESLSRQALIVDVTDSPGSLRQFRS